MILVTKNKSITLNTFIAKNILTIEEAEAHFNQIISEGALSEDLKKNLMHLYTCALKNGNPTLFPKIPVSSDKVNDPDEYINKWIERYVLAAQNKPSDRVAKMKQSVDDPILKTMIKEEKDYSDERVDIALDDHNLYMSAENIQGSLLEEYIDTHISKYDWVWAEGETIRACDFIKYNASNDSYTLLQIKNKYNSENSSSSAIRANTEIKKWYRLGQKTVNKVIQPKYRWNELNKIIGVEDEMSEDNYAEFITQIAHKNKNLLI